MLTKKSALAAALAAALVGLTAAAPAGARPYEGYGYGAQGPGFEGRGGHRGEFGGGMMRELDLSDAQRNQMFEIRHAAQPAMHAKMSEFRKNRIALREAATAKDYDAGRVRQLADEGAKLQADLTVMRIETQQKTLAVLTPEQRAKLAQLREQRRGYGGRR
ncbi:MAG: Spy/CpxP family protein refolding chaperone [Burkholderiales bacterium]|nr:Spy/CpxP family protein refolding chaperone [Burkholderiales bacterium]